MGLQARPQKGANDPDAIGHDEAILAHLHGLAYHCYN